MKLTLDPGEEDWHFGDLLRLETGRPHTYEYLFVARKPRFYATGGEPNDRGFLAIVLGVPDCPYGKTDAALPCGYHHGDFGEVRSSFGGLPSEPAWVRYE